MLSAGIEGTATCATDSNTVGLNLAPTRSEQATESTRILKVLRFNLDRIRVSNSSNRGLGV